MKSKDNRKSVGGHVHAKALHVVHERTTQRRYGSNFKVKILPGVVTEVNIRAKNGRNQTWIKATYYLGGSIDDPKNVVEKELLLGSVKSGWPDGESFPPLPCDKNGKGGSVEGKDKSSDTKEQKKGKKAVSFDTQIFSDKGKSPAATPSKHRRTSSMKLLTPIKDVPLEVIKKLHCVSLELNSAENEEVEEEDEGAVTSQMETVSDENNNGSNKNSKRDPLVPNGIKWEEDTSRISTSGIGKSIPTRTWRLQSQHDADMFISAGCDTAKTFGPFEYFMMLFPETVLQMIVVYTNVLLISKGLAATSAGEILTFFGTLLLGTFFKFGDRRSLWSKRSDSDNPYIPAPNFGRTGLSRDRFNQLFVNIRFSSQPSKKPEGMTFERWRWMLVDVSSRRPPPRFVGLTPHYFDCFQDFVEGFNEHRRKYFHPGQTLVVDESFAEWYGLGGSYINIGLPMYTSVDRKPHDGCEIQDAADGESGVMLRLKVVKSPEEAARLAKERPRPWHDWDITHGGKIAFDLVEPWLDSDRVVAVDSFFASVNTALKFEERRTGLIGSVKGATTGFPMHYLSTVESNGKRGGKFVPYKVSFLPRLLLTLIAQSISRLSYLD